MAGIWTERKNKQKKKIGTGTRRVRLKTRGQGVESEATGVPFREGREACGGGSIGGQGAAERKREAEKMPCGGFFWAVCPPLLSRHGHPHAHGAPASFVPLLGLPLRGRVACFTTRFPASPSCITYTSSSFHGSPGLPCCAWPCVLSHLLHLCSRSSSPFLPKRYTLHHISCETNACVAHRKRKSTCLFSILILESSSCVCFQNNLLEKQIAVIHSTKGID